MKKIYIVSYAGYKPSVAFESAERAEAVRAMCGGSVDEVQVLDAAPSAAELLAHITALDDDGDDEGSDGDGL